MAEVPLCVLTVGMENRRILDHAIAAAGGRLDAVVEADAADVLWAHVRTLGWSCVLAHSWLSDTPPN